MRQELLELMEQEGFTKEEIKNFEVKMILSEKFLEGETKLSEVEIVSLEEYFSESYTS